MRDSNNSARTTERLMAGIVRDTTYVTDVFSRQTDQLIGRGNGGTHGAGMFSSRSGGGENLLIIADKAAGIGAELHRTDHWLGGPTAVGEAPGESKVPTNTPE